MDITSYLLGKQAGGGSAPVLQDKEVEITENGETTITADSGYDGLRSVDVDTNVQPDLESKSITISTNTTTTIEPTQGKDGLSSVEVTTAVPQPSGKIEITQNGTDIDVSSYALADVSVPSQKYTPHTGIRFLDLGNVTDLSYEINNIDTQYCTQFYMTFAEAMSVTTMDISSWNTSNVTSMSYCFSGCTNLTNLNLSSWTSTSLSRAGSMFVACTSLQHLDIRNFDFTKLTTSTAYQYMFGNVSSTYVPANCLIIVKDATQKQWLNTNFSRLTNVKTVAEYEGS